MLSRTKSSNLAQSMVTATHRDSSQILKYNPQLDGLRFFAVLFVVTYHWVPAIEHFEYSDFLGGFINFFFVLSSYLITRILFSAKEKSVEAGVAKYKVMIVFLLRRTIRIFPAYYVYLLILLILPVIGDEVRKNAGMYFGYLANYQIFYDQAWQGVTPHLWTLAVEEQFYVFWPFVILFIPQRFLPKAFLLIIILGIILRVIFYQPSHVVTQLILTQYCIDSFAIGALLAYKVTRPASETRIINKCINGLLYLAIPAVIFILVMESHYFSFVIGGLLYSIISMKIIEGAVFGYNGKLGRFLQNKVVVYIGQISYGIYLYHLLVPVLFWRLFDKVYALSHASFPDFFIRNEKWLTRFVNILSSQVSCYILYAVLTIAVAMLSWNLIEKPFFKLKVFASLGKQKSSMDVKRA
ncbi:acyltransferase [Pedobacter nyackensis]|uniref:acyltransferase family protein n=1 Tax=Pedobacter nyackensis TaxID=475255 RepID=UPI00292E007E|nr:acyltransferase [Pedobacter nyackensis]